MELNGKVVVVSGAGSGMGRELTIQLVKLGAVVAMVDINEENLKATAQLAGIDNTSYKVLDISDKEAVATFPEWIIQQHGQVDVLINNAGIIQPFVNVDDLSLETIERIININFYGTLYMTRAFLPYLKQRPKAHLANIASMGGFIPFPGQTIYSASKAAVKIMTEGLYAELKNTNVGVSIIYPGAINTNIIVNSGLDTTKSNTPNAENYSMMPADKAASEIIEAIKNNKFNAFVGKDASFLDKFYRINPKRAIDFIVNKMSKK